MVAVINAGGVQHRVSVGDEITVNHLGEAKGSIVEFSALFVSSDDGVKVGTPTVDGVLVKAEVLSEPNSIDADGNRVWGERAQKIDIYRYNRRHRTRKSMGFRQSITRLQITEISG